MESSRPQRRFVITGGNSGLGLETARKLAAASPWNTVILACRDMRKGAEAQRAITEATGNSRALVMHLDLSSLDSVREFSAQLQGPIDALVCNAGIASGPTETADGYDTVFETNHLGHFLLVSLLADRMSADGRVLSVSSDMHRPPGPKLRWPGADALARPPLSSAVRRQRYSYSKLCNLYFSYELSRRLRETESGVVAVAFNPGLMTDTNFATMPRAVAFVMQRVFASRLGNLESSSRALADLASTVDGALLDGHYFDRTASAPTRSSALSYSVPNARDLWQVSERLVESSVRPRD
ncbi:MAG TPA: SDR family NAD(P)-dependent oxidoreductase [Galbitalea sp.]|jgi:NAD(P)-dependent dehydrogenase (short-subunit alcohol dehydrogenase family)|nr:SDR family NAD(P)-dependent oxidoreductase [Nitrolancea sp.]